MYRNFLSLIKLFPLILVLITSCVLDIENPTEESLSIEWISIDYDQAENAVTNFVLLESFPVQIITGNSSGMKELVFGILKEHGFYYYFRDSICSE